MNHDITDKSQYNLLPRPIIVEEPENIISCYGVSENCVNDDSYGEICVKCGLCGRIFEGGELTDIRVEKGGTP